VEFAMIRGPWIRRSLIAFVVLGLAPQLAGAQSLADVARAEEARRKEKAKPAKVYTNDNLRRDTSAPTPAAPATPSAAAPATAAPATTEPTPPATDAKREPEQGEKYWKDRIGAARADLERSKTFAAALESRIGALTLDFVNRDDPAQRAVIEQNRQKAVAELERVQRDIATQTKAITGIEEEARKAGVPAGWLR
jgi:hypothetical protein